MGRATEGTDCCSCAGEGKGGGEAPVFNVKCSRCRYTRWAGGRIYVPRKREIEIDGCGEEM
jgi:hypothetical protein